MTTEHFWNISECKHWLLLLLLWGSDGFKGFQAPVWTCALRTERQEAGKHQDFKTDKVQKMSALPFKMK